MKKVFKTLALVAVAGATLMSFTLTNTSENTPNTVEAVQEGPKMVFAEKEFNFGNIKQGDKVEHTFKFTNEGDAPLIINTAKGSCGCTVPSYPKEPILPGESGDLHVVFNSAGKRGAQRKSVTINTNQGTTPVVIYIVGEVEVPTQEVK
ncbi:DUF1573 domain-containing protein [Cyclobacteriaceae bacterium]|nr:DUF1573 domain-containing protein [Cyclobacteriaceae bacterium]